MSFSIETTNKFDRALKRCIKRGYNLDNFKSVVDILAEKGSLLPKYLPHKLSGKFNNCWECHIEPDWLLIWQQNDKILTLLFIDTGTHSDIFG